MKNSCKLCLKREADKPNSHIIPKFISKRLFESTKPRHSIEINRKGKSRKIQDTPKENFILCNSCEKRLEYLETLISRKIISINNYKNLKNDFNLIKIGNTRILQCLKIDPISFKLFIYSVVWRTSISNLKYFESFKLDSETEGLLRSSLDRYLKCSHSELVKSISKISDLPSYHYCIFKPVVRNKFSRGIFTAYRMDEFAYGIFTVDYIIYFYPNTTNMDETFQYVSNFQNNRILITLAEADDWRLLNRSVLSNLLNNNNNNNRN